MLTLSISQEQLQSAFQDALNDMLKTGNYKNPVTRTLDEMLGYSGSMRGELGNKITSFLSTAMETPEFQAILGKAIAEEMAKRAVDAMEKKN